MQVVAHYTREHWEECGELPRDGNPFYFVYNAYDADVVQEVTEVTMLWAIILEPDSIEIQIRMMLPSLWSKFPISASLSVCEFSHVGQMAYNKGLQMEGDLDSPGNGFSERPTCQAVRTQGDRCDAFQLISCCYGLRAVKKKGGKRAWCGQPNCVADLRQINLVDCSCTDNLELVTNISVNSRKLAFAKPEFSHRLLS